MIAQYKKYFFLISGLLLGEIILGSFLSGNYHELEPVFYKQINILITLGLFVFSWLIIKKVFPDIYQWIASSEKIILNLPFRKSTALFLSPFIGFYFFLSAIETGINQCYFSTPPIVIQSYVAAKTIKHPSSKNRYSYVIPTPNGTIQFTKTENDQNLDRFDKVTVTLQKGLLNAYVIKQIIMDKNGKELIF